MRELSIKAEREGAKSEAPLQFSQMFSSGGITCGILCKHFWWFVNLACQLNASLREMAWVFLLPQLGCTLTGKD